MFLSLRGEGGLSQSKSSSIILKKGNIFSFKQMYSFAALYICLYMLEVISVT